MDDGCIKNIFDWLSIEDLSRLRMTCKRVYLLANEHFQMTYGQLYLNYKLSNKDNKYGFLFASQVQTLLSFEYDFAVTRRQRPLRHLLRGRF